MHSSFTAMIVSCRKYISVAHSSLLGYKAHLLQSREVFNINSTAIAKQHRRSIIHGSKQSCYSPLVTPMYRARRIQYLDEHNFSISKAEWVDLFSSECLYTSSRQHSITISDLPEDRPTVPNHERQKVISLYCVALPLFNENHHISTTKRRL